MNFLYFYIKLKVYGFNKFQVILDGNSLEGTPVKSCGGSGGVYFQKNKNGLIEITGIHSAGVMENTSITIHNKFVTIPPFFQGGTNLTQPSIRRWITETAKKNGC